MPVIYFRNCTIEGDLATALQKYQDDLGEAMSSTSSAISDMQSSMSDIQDTITQNKDPDLLDLAAANTSFTLDNSPTTLYFLDPGWNTQLNTIIKPDDIVSLYNGFTVNDAKLTGPQIIDKTHTGWRILSVPKQEETSATFWDQIFIDGAAPVTTSGLTAGGSDVITSSGSFFQQSDQFKRITIDAASVPAIQGSYIIYNVISATQVHVRKMVDAAPPTIPFPTEEAIFFPVSTITSLTLSRGYLSVISTVPVQSWSVEVDGVLPDLSDYQNALFSTGVATEVRRNRKGILTTSETLLSNASNTNVNTLDKLAVGTDLAKPLSGSDRSYWEQRLESSGAYVVNGKYIPQGGVDLTGFRRLISLIGCDLPSIENYLKDSFVVVMTYFGASVFTDSDCKPVPIVTTTMEEKVIGVNISVASAAAQANVTEADIKIRFFWSGKQKFDATTVKRLSNLGITGANLTSIVTLEINSTVESYTISPSTIIADMKSGLGLNTADICELAKRTTGPIALAKLTFDQTAKKIMDGINRSPTPKAGGSDTETSGGIMFAYLDPFESLDVKKKLDTAVAAASSGVGEGVGSSGVDGIDNQKCLTLLSAFDTAMRTVSTLLETVQGQLGSLSLNLNASAGMISSLFPDLMNCVNPTLPSLALNLELGLGELGMNALITKFTALLDKTLASSKAFKAALCGVEALINALVGGVCGLSVGNLAAICGAEVVEAFKSLQAVLGIVQGMIAALFSSVTKASTNVNKAFALSFGPIPALTCSAADAANRLVQMALPG